MIAIHETGTPAPCPSPFNLAAYVLAGGAATPSKIALQVVGPTGAERWSYERLTAAVRGTGGGLRDMGLRPGDRILMRLGNTVDFPILFLAAIAVGAVPVPTSSQLTVPEITRIAAEIRPALIAAAADVALPDHPGCPVIGTDMLAAWRDHPPAEFASGDPERLAYIIYTSGSSGVPRAVMHAHRAVWARRMMWTGWYGTTSADRILHAGAFNWTYTLGTGLLDPWAMGATALIPATGSDPANLGLLMKRYDATVFAAAPGVYRQILKHGLPAMPRLRHGLSAGEKLPETVRTAWTAATGTAIHEALGMSECSTFISASPGRPAPAGISGYPQDGRRIAVLGSDGAPVARGEAGTLAIDRSDPGLFLGYLDAPAETAARTRGRWFLTGDTVSMGDDGAITYLGRDDDMMNAGGFRVSPVEVESAMVRHPGIAEAAACELRLSAETSVIGLFWSGPEDVTDAALSAFATENLARYKQPRLFIRMPALPHGANGKVSRRKLREEFEAKHG